MIRALGVLCLLGSLSLSSALPPCVCARNLKPVCGSDGKTYNNECLLRCAKLSDQELVVERNGRCDDAKLQPDDCICTFDFRPVCGTDGKTYPNQCSLTCAQRSAPIETAHQGECRRKRESVQVAELPLPSCACTFELSPVCGSDGLTYDNPCMLKCARETDGDLKLSHMGACEDKVKVVDSAPASCICTKNAKPVCGTDGKTYSNPCNLNCAREVDESLHIDHVGPCGEGVNVVESTTRPDCACTRNLRPVCASNGVTYSNACLMRCAGTHLTIVKDEPCET